MRWHRHCQARLLCSAPGEALLTPARTKSIMINCTNWCGRSQGCGSTLLTSTLGKEHRYSAVSAAWAPLGTKSPATPHSLRHPGSGQAPVWGSLLEGKWWRRLYITLTISYPELAPGELWRLSFALGTADLVASPELLWGLIPIAEMGRGLGLTSSDPDWPQGRHPEHWPVPHPLAQEKGVHCRALTGSAGEGSVLLMLRWLFVLLTEGGDTVPSGTEMLVIYAAWGKCK